MDEREIQGAPALQGSGYATAPDGVELYYRLWEPEAPRALLVALHGLAAHGEWYDTLAAHLLPRDVATLAPDARGHGLTRWDLGRLPGPDLLVEDVLFWMDRLSARHPGVPLFVLGTSLGGCLAVAAAGEAAHRGRRAERAGRVPGTSSGSGPIAGVALVSPSFGPLYLGWGEKSRMAISLLFGRQDGAETPLGRDLPLTSDRLRLQWLRRDPLALSWLPARTHWNANQLIRRARGVLHRVRVPMLCVQGGQDPVTSADVNRALFEGRPNARFVLWEEGMHELALELDVGYLAGVLADWLRHHGARARAATSAARPDAARADGEAPAPS